MKLHLYCNNGTDFISDVVEWPVAPREGEWIRFKNKQLIVTNIIHEILDEEVFVELDR